MSSNGGACVFRAICRYPGNSGSWNCSGSLSWDASFCTVGVGGKSPFTWLSPLRIFRDADAMSVKPSWKVISSRYAGRQSVSGSQFGLRTSLISLPGV